MCCSNVDYLCYLSRWHRFLSLQYVLIYHANIMWNRVVFFPVNIMFPRVAWHLQFTKLTKRFTPDYYDISTASIIAWFCNRNIRKWHKSCRVFTWVNSRYHVRIRATAWKSCKRETGKTAALTVSWSAWLKPSADVTSELREVLSLQCALTNCERFLFGCSPGSVICKLCALISSLWQLYARAVVSKEINREVLWSGVRRDIG